MTEAPLAYGLWGLALANSAVVITFAASFTYPYNEGDWRALGGFSIFIVALFAEMYGFPLTIYLVLPLVDGGQPGPLPHDDAHLWWVLVGQSDNPDRGVPHLISLTVIVGGFALLASGWAALDTADRMRVPATTGPYAFIRHPQYAALMLIMLGLLLRGPTLPTVAMFPVLVLFYVRLAKDEEHWTAIAFGGQYSGYLAATPRWLPNLRRMGKPDPSRADDAYQPDHSLVAAHGRRRWLALLWRYLALILGMNLAWEVAQLPLYTIWTEGSASEIAFAVLHCTGGDAVIALVSLAAALSLVRPSRWPAEGFSEVLLSGTFIGIVATIVSEWLNVDVLRNWAYSEWMPVVPRLGTGLAPLLQWVLIPPLCMIWLRRIAVSGDLQTPKSNASQR